MLHLFVRLKGQNVGHKLNRVAMVCQQCDVTVTNTVTHLQLKYSIRFCSAEFLQSHESFCRDTDASLKKPLVASNVPMSCNGPNKDKRQCPVQYDRGRFSDADNVKEIH